VRVVRENIQPRTSWIDWAIARSIQQDRGWIFFRTARTVEVSKFFIIWHCTFVKNRYAMRTGCMPSETLWCASAYNFWYNCPETQNIDSISLTSRYLLKISYYVKISKLKILTRVVNVLMDHLHYRLNFGLDKNFITAWKSITKLVIFQSFVAKCCKMRII
jgi:hypothetical protein